MRDADGKTSIVDDTDHSKPERPVLGENFDPWINRLCSSPSAFHGAFDAPHIGGRPGVRTRQKKIRDGCHLIGQIT